MKRIWIAVGLLWIAGIVDAQYFGQNRVKYDTFDFEVLETEHFDIYFYPEEREAARDVARMSERWYARHRETFDHDLVGRQILVLYASHPDFQQNNIVHGIGEGTGGVTESARRRIVLPVGASLAETDHVVGHELVHAFQYDIAAGGRRRLGRTPAGLMPLWFVEGTAEYLSIGAQDPHTAMWMRDAVQRDGLPSANKLTDPRYFPYRYGHALMAYIGGTYGAGAVSDLLKRASALDGDVRTAVRDVLAVPIDTLVTGWHRSLRSTYGPVLETTQPAESYGKRILASRKRGRDLNVGPVLSPDGSRLIFLSSRSRLSIEVYLADAETGEVIRRLTKTAVDPHLQNLQFIYSTGSWSPDGSRIVLAMVREGRPVLTIHDAASGGVVRRIRLRSVAEAFHPVWSPDGSRIVFAGLSRGVSDLYSIDLESDRVERLTDDAYGDLHPAISPDGRYVAFATERFTSDLDRMVAGELRLAILDLETGDIRRIRGRHSGKQINPQWSKDGDAIYFVSDRHGVSDLYRVASEGGRPERLTALSTGISGITATSPALSAARHTGSLALGVYESDGYSIYTIEDPDRLEDLAPPEAEIRRRTATLPPERGEDHPVERRLADAGLGLPASLPDTTRKYKPDLTLESIGQPTIAVGVDRTGAFIGGGVSFLFRDLLGNHNLLTAARLDQNFDNAVGTVVYQNLKTRLNWGLAAQSSRLTNGQIRTAVGQLPDSTRVVIREVFKTRQFIQDAEGMLLYPLSRATRFESSLGFGFTSFSRNIKRETFNPSTGRRVEVEDRDLPAPASLKTARLNVAMVYDASARGSVSPILGRRARVDVSPTVGSLNYVEALADGRQYFSPVEPYTLAVRGLFFGRFGSDAGDNRLPQLFLGYPGLVRGYDAFSLNFTETVFDQLEGTRMAVAKAELRFPLTHLLTLGRGSWASPLPIEVGGFYDGGMTWGVVGDGTAPPSQEWIDSAGALIRIGLGYVALEWDYVKPFDRPDEGWIWQFNFLTPGF